MKNTFLTVSTEAQEEIVINKSRFIGYVSPCETEQEAVSFLQKIREAHKTAKHHCYAYIIGENCGTMRYSDDGEPGGTAGMPIMDVMRLKGIVNCCIVVVRYFGGILLGTGGLVRAYTQSAQAALESAGIVRMELTCVVSCSIPYSVWDRLRYAADHLPVRISHVEYGDAICFNLYYRSVDRETIIPGILSACDRKMVILSQQETFCAWEL